MNLGNKIFLCFFPACLSSQSYAGSVEDGFFLFVNLNTRGNALTLTRNICEIIESSL